jgi:hypothetical protein
VEDKGLTYWEFVTRRKALLVVLCVTVLAVALRLVVAKHERRVPSDTRCFLEVVAMIRGELGQREVTPQRVGSPLYPLLILLGMQFRLDWLVSAERVALVASSLTPAAFCLIGWALEQKLGVGLVAGRLVAQGVTPLAGALYILLIALALLTSLALLRRPTVRWATLAGALGGLAWATWGIGGFCLVATGLPLVVSLRERRKAGEVAPRQAWGLLGAFLVALVVCGQGPAIAIRPYARGLKPPLPYLKACLVEGSLYAEGTTHRDRVVYTLNDDCTGFAYQEEIRRHTLLQLLRKYGGQQFTAFLKNVDTCVRELLPRVLSPFLLLFIPLGLGLQEVARRRPWPEPLLLLLFAVPYLLIVPAIQLQPRYVYGITAVAFPVAALGFAHLWAWPGPRRRLARAGGLAILVYALVSGEQAARHFFEEERDEAYAYRKACEWLVEQTGRDFDYFVMSRYQGAFAFFRRNHIHMPVDEPERVARFCRNTNTRYILYGKLEKFHNLDLLRALGGHRRCVIEGMNFAIVKTVDTGSGPAGVCHVIEVRPARAKAGRGAGRPDERPADSSAGDPT